MSDSLPPPFKLSQLPLADRMTGVLALYLEKLEQLTPAERIGFAALFAWLPTVIVFSRPDGAPGGHGLPPQIELESGRHL